MWNDREVRKQWMKSRETGGQVRFLKDTDKGLYVSKIELKVSCPIIFLFYVIDNCIF